MFTQAHVIGHMTDRVDTIARMHTRTYVHTYIGSKCNISRLTRQLRSNGGKASMGQSVQPEAERHLL